MSAFQISIILSLLGLSFSTIGVILSLISISLNLKNKNDDLWKLAGNDDLWKRAGSPGSIDDNKKENEE